jgi:poly(3-hydroxybutyrate) depolymerase
MSTAIMAQTPNKPQVKSMILMGGPVDARVNPGAVNHFAQEHSIDWFEKNVISKVPVYHKGYGRSVCPGFLMLNGFINMNLERHQEAYFSMFQHLIQGDEDSAEKHRRFYDEYRAVMDLPSEYFLESVQKVFQEFQLPRGEMTWRGKKIDLSKIEKTALLTIEGQLDDISCVGQTYAAQQLCNKIPKHLRQHHEQEGVGHYGIFNGSKWRKHIQPKIKDFIYAVEGERL